MYLNISDKPSPPLNPTARPVDKTHLDASWEVPESDGGSPITHYIIEKKDVTKKNWTAGEKVEATELKCTLGKLVEGKDYLIRVSAENEIGRSEPAQIAEPVTAKLPFGKKYIQRIDNCMCYEYMSSP